VDGDAFDAWMRRALRDPSRRGVLRVGTGGLVATVLGLSGLSAGQAAHADNQLESRSTAGGHNRGRMKGRGKKNKKDCPPCKKKKNGKCKRLAPDGSACPGGTCHGGACVLSPSPPPGPPPNPWCPGDGRYCGMLSICCPGDNVCCFPDFSLPDGAQCYPPGYHCCLNGPACASGQECCPSKLGYAYPATCATPALGEHCCEPGSGGFCAADEACCPPASSNLENEGCCLSGVTCCNDTSDCNEAAGEACLSGCCG
jgi:hypothetical protein